MNIMISYHRLVRTFPKNTTRTFDLVNENVAAINQIEQAAQELALLAEKQKEELSFFKLG
ncbi:hypothetical protein [Aeromonas caviae]|uniref:hypothetical protein n=1 Tax=Aeromonas caviae TaxID=648 RepID=UPI00214F4CC9|nr:hypothetical protein [Aeromonas caviae]MCR3895697.1 hypothetical protein [Aeromonas caviae]